MRRFGSFRFGTKYADPTLDDFNWKKQLGIAGAASAQTNYQIMLTVYPGVGIDTPGVVYLNNKSRRPDLSDLRFVDQYGVNIPYSFEDVLGVAITNPWTVWLNIPAIPITGTTISVLVGNNTAQSATNGLTTFALYDNFDSYDTVTKWTTISGSPTASASVLTIPSGANIYGKTSYGQNYAIRIRSNIPSVSSYASIGFQDEPNAKGIIVYSHHPTSNRFALEVRNPVGATQTNVDMGTGWTGYHIYDIGRFGTSLARCVVDNTSVYSSATNVTDVNTPVQLFGQGQQIYVDWAIVRKYVYPEPAHSWSGVMEANS